MKRMLRTLAAVVFFVAIAASAGAQGGGTSKADEAKMHVDAAKKYLAKGAMMAARQHIKLALKKDPKNFEAHFLMGVSFYLEENRGGTLRWMGKALKIKPGHQQANFYAGKAELDLEHLDKAIKYLKKAKAAKEGYFDDPTNQMLLPYYMGVCLVKQGKGKEAAKILKPLAEGGKFDGFGMRKDGLRKLYFEGYMHTGEAFTVQGLYAQADAFLTKGKNNCFQLNEGKWAGRDFQSLYRYNKHRVLIQSQGQIQKDTFINLKTKFMVTKVKGWDFVFHHPECFEVYGKNSKGMYEQATQAACAAIWLIRKNKERIYEMVIDITVDAWDLNTNLTICDERVSLSSPKDVARTRLGVMKRNFDPFVNRRIRPFLPKVQKMKFNRKYRAAWFKGSFEHKENKNDKRDREFWCFVSSTHSFFLDILGEHGIFEKYAREIETIKRSMSIKKK